jgi:hypothetical protein
LCSALRQRAITPSEIFEPTIFKIGSPCLILARYHPAVQRLVIVSLAIFCLIAVMVAMYVLTLGFIDCAFAGVHGALRHVLNRREAVRGFEVLPAKQDSSLPGP